MGPEKNGDITSDARRLWRWIQARVGDAARKGDDINDDPEVLLDRAQREMQQMHTQNRNRAVQAITHKNELERAVQNVRARAAELRTEAEAAEQCGDMANASRRRMELQECEAELAQGEALLAQAKEAAQSVKEAIRREEEVIRRKMSEALALKAQWRSAQMETALTRSQEALEALRRIEATDGSDEQSRDCLREAVHVREALRLTQKDLMDKVAALREKANAARKQGAEEDERALLREMEQFEAALEATQTALGRAEEVVGRMQGALNEAGLSVAEGALEGTVTSIGEPFTRNEKAWLWVTAVFAIAALLVLLALL